MITSAFDSQNHFPAIHNDSVQQEYSSNKKYNSVLVKKQWHIRLVSH